MTGRTRIGRGRLGATAGISRRRFLGVAGAGAAGAVVLGGGGLLAACGDDDESGGGGGGGSDTITIGYVTPRTGALAPFGEADSFVLEQIRALYEGGIKIGGTTYALEIIDRDSQSDSARASEVAQTLILDDGIDLMLVSSTPDTTNPVADQCETNQIPCISSVAPWQPYYIGRGADPADPSTAFDWTYHFFWGLEDIIGVFLAMWGEVDTNQVVGALWPNDPDGNAWGDPTNGFPTPLTEAGYTIVDPGRYTDGTSDFSAQIAQFKAEGVQILTGVPIPPDFTTFWTQAAQQGFEPRVASIGKALLFPSAVEALGDVGDGLSTEVWWSPEHPYSSSLTDQSAADLAADFEAEVGQWTQPLGFAHALFEVAIDVLQRAGGPGDKDAVVAAIKETNLDTVVGNVDFSAGPVPNVAKTKLVGGQWRTGTDHPYELVIVSNDDLPEVPVAGTLEAIT